MFFKRGNYVKQEGERFSPAEHNTVGIPDHMVVTCEKDVPVITLACKFKTLEEKTKAEVLAVIKCMNLQGKFVSKAWVCKALNFKERKADDIFVALKREGKIQELLAVHRTVKTGTYYRLAGRTWKVKVQLIHRKMRRMLRGPHESESSKLSQKGSLEQSTFSEISSGTGENKNLEGTACQASQIISEVPVVEEALTAENNYGFTEVKRVKRQRALYRDYPDGSPGDGRNGTQYTAAGCYNRLIVNPDQNDKEIVRLLTWAAHPEYKEICPSLARSLARRIDSQTITYAKADMVTDHLCGKNVQPNKRPVHMSVRDLILSFGSLTEKYMTKIREGELDSFTFPIEGAMYGSPRDTVMRLFQRTHASIVSQRKALAVTNTVENYDSFVNMMHFNASPIYANLAVFRHLEINPDYIHDIIIEFQDLLFKQLCNDDTAVRFLRDDLRFDFIDWTAFDLFKIQYLENIHNQFSVNNLFHAKLFNYINTLKTAAKAKYNFDSFLAYCIEFPVTGSSSDKHKL